MKMEIYVDGNLIVTIDTTMDRALMVHTAFEGPVWSPLEFSIPVQ